MPVTPGHLLVHCRAGFEGECAGELTARGADLGYAVYARARPGAAVLTVHPAAPEALPGLYQELIAQPPVFPRALWPAMGPLGPLPEGDRAGPIADAAEALAAEQDRPFGELWLETADTNEAKQLAGFLRRFAGPLRAALRQRGLLEEQTSAPRLHLCFLDSRHLHLGTSDSRHGPRWPMGIPRLRRPRAAPSRSTLKLEEALLLFLDSAERGQRLAPGMRAVDLGAAPGGWTWQLVRRHLAVVAVDNGPMDPALLDSGLVTHRREDGFNYRPPAPVDWMVCDMAERPGRVARLAAHWVASGWAGEAIFNLKLPMKQRLAEVTRHQALIREHLSGEGVRGQLVVRQLYHDREEVTAHLRRLA